MLPLVAVVCKSRLPTVSTSIPEIIMFPVLILPVAAVVMLPVTLKLVSVPTLAMFG